MNRPIALLNPYAGSVYIMNHKQTWDAMTPSPKPEFALGLSIASHVLYVGTGRITGASDDVLLADLLTYNGLYFDAVNLSFPFASFTASNSMLFFVVLSNFSVSVSDTLSLSCEDGILSCTSFDETAFSIPVVLPFVLMVGKTDTVCVAVNGSVVSTFDDDTEEWRLLLSGKFSAFALVRSLEFGLTLDSYTSFCCNQYMTLYDCNASISYSGDAYLRNAYSYQKIYTDFTVSQDEAGEKYCTLSKGMTVDFEQRDTWSMLLSVCVVGNTSYYSEIYKCPDWVLSVEAVPPDYKSAHVVLTTTSRKVLTLVDNYRRKLIFEFVNTGDGCTIKIDGIEYSTESLLLSTSKIGTTENVVGLYRHIVNLVARNIVVGGIYTLAGKGRSLRPSFSSLVYNDSTGSLYYKVGVSGCVSQNASYNGSSFAKPLAANDRVVLDFENNWKANAIRWQSNGPSWIVHASVDGAQWHFVSALCSAYDESRDCFVSYAWFSAASYRFWRFTALSSKNVPFSVYEWEIWYDEKFSSTSTDSVKTSSLLMNIDASMVETVYDSPLLEIQYENAAIKTTS